MAFEATDDGLEIADVGRWCRRKYHFLGRYLDAFTTAMRKKWAELHYIDLFCGPGLARIRQTDNIEIGSPLIAAGLRFPFTCIHLCDRKQLNCSALETRLLKHFPQTNARVLRGDANEIVADLIRPIPRRNALCMTLADPFGLHLDFQTLEQINALQTDLIVLLADNMDALRNWAAYYIDNPASNLDRFMGERGWRELLQNAPDGSGAERLRDRYLKRLEDRLGFSHFATMRVQNSQDRDIYTLIYATKAEAGLKIWNRISQTDETGQRGLAFD